MEHPDVARLRAEHTPAAISARLTSAARQSYLGDAVLGAVDGTVTTFAIVAGSLGAGISGTIALVLGLANVVADGFSMAASNYLKCKSDGEIVERARRIEEHHVEMFPDGEREEVRQLFSRKGFEGRALEEVVAVVTSDRKRWVDTMLTEEHGLPLKGPTPARAALTTFAAFLVAGAIPLIPLVAFEGRASFQASAAATAAAFLAIGILKAKVTARSLARSAAETLLVGSAAAALAFFVGSATKALVS
jgi:VIT1/CCC1 family predicted Fe2+/Mn2+ transporter